jgi:AAA domain
MLSGNKEPGEQRRLKIAAEAEVAQAAFRAVMADTEMKSQGKKGTAASASTASPALKVVGLHEFMATELPAREKILAPWVMTQSLNMVHGWRGIGKTHVSLGIFYAIGTGGSFLNWKADKAHKALLIDGEMPGAALQERLAAIIASSVTEPQPGYLSILTPDLQSGSMPDLASYEGQDRVNEIIEKVQAEVIIVDNLSCLVRGAGRENDAESWVSVSEWALLQRQHGRSVIFIHHSGKDGKQRGTSKREDLLDVVVALRRPPDYDPATGACFEVHFEKARHLSGEDVSPVEAQLSTDAEGITTWTWRRVSDSTFDRVVSLANEGLSQAEISNELGVNRSNVSRAWRKASDEGLITSKASGRGNNQYRKARDGQ